MLDLRNTKLLDLSESICLKENTTFKFKDKITGKDLISKFIAYYNDDKDEYLLGEFKKLFLLSGEPEIGTVYYLASAVVNEDTKNCYVMDFIQGNTLENVLNDHKYLQFDYILDLLKQIASGIEKSHNYEITHGDLHEGNIMIDNFGFVKIIDFAFWGEKIDFKKNVEYDIVCFNEIVELLGEKCQIYERTNFKVIKDLCLSIDTFKNLRKQLDNIEEIIFEYNLLDQTGKRVISSIINEIPFDINLSMVLQEKDLEIPSNPKFELTEQETSYLEKNREYRNNPDEKYKKIRLLYDDSRIERIKHYFNQEINYNANQLRLAGLIEWYITVSNSGEDFVGPYNLNFDIYFMPKLLKWKKVNEIIPFLNIDEEMKLQHLLFKDIYLNK